MTCTSKCNMLNSRFRPRILQLYKEIVYTSQLMPGDSGKTELKKIANWFVC